MTAMQIYLLLKLDDFQSLLKGFGILISLVSGFATVMVFVFSVIDDDDAAKTCRRIRWKVACIFATGLTALLMATVIPSTKQMAAIIVVPKVCNAVMADSLLKRIPGQITALASDWLEELKPAAAKEKDGPATSANNGKASNLKNK